MTEEGEQRELSDAVGELKADANPRRAELGRRLRA